MIDCGQESPTARARAMGTACTQRVRGFAEHARLCAASYTAHDGQIHQRNNQRRGQNEDQGDGEHAHELAGNARPEQHRQERAERRRGR